MKNSFRHFIIVITVFITVSTAFIIGVYQKSDTSSSLHNFSDKKQIRILSNWSGSLKRQVLRNTLDQYQKLNNDIVITDDFADEPLFHIRLTTDFCSGYAPDIVASHLDSSIYSLIDGGHIADLTNVIANDDTWSSDINKSLLRSASYNGKIYAVPSERSYILLYLNKDIMQKYGLSAPSNISELWNCVRVLAANGVTPFAFSAQDSNMYFYQALVASLSGSKQLKTDFDNKTVDKNYYEAFEIMRKLKNEGAFPENYASVDSYDASAMFLSKNAAMIVESSDFVSEIYSYSLNRTDVPIASSDAQDIDIQLFPSASQSIFRPTAAFLGDCTYYLSQNAYEKKADICIPLLKHITSKDVATDMLISAKADIMNKTHTPPASHGKLFTSSAETILNAQEFTLMPDTVIDKRLWHSEIFANLVPILEGSTDPVTVWSKALSLMSDITE